MHQRGSEVVLCTAGGITLNQGMSDASTATVTLSAGQYFVSEL